MRIYTKSGDLAFSTFTFPDGQPHFTLETYEREFLSVTVETAIRNPTDLFTTGLVVEVLRNVGYSEVNLDIRYLMGARMDRAIDPFQPFTLASVARVINGMGLSKVRVLDVHSDVAIRLIRNCENVLPKEAVNEVIATTVWGKEGCIVTPDKGAMDRVIQLTSMWGMNRVTCRKTRDTATGNLSGFVVDYPTVIKGYGNTHCIILDDICDGGGTFVGLAKELRKAGAKKVFLFVTHGIFSKGLPLDGIDHVFTTDSYCNRDSWGGCVVPVDHVVKWPTVIRISMKELK